MFRIPIAIAVCLYLAATAVAGAQESERFQLQRTDDGYVRLDTRTGAVSTCTERSGQLVCRLAADERNAYSDEIAALQERLEILEGRVTALEESKPGPNKLPTDKEFDETMGMMERFFRRFMGIVKEFEKDFGNGSDSSETPSAERT